MSPNDRDDKLWSWLLRAIVVTSLLLGATYLVFGEPLRGLEAASTGGVAFIGLIYRSAWLKAHAKPVVNVSVKCTTRPEEIADLVRREMGRRV